MKIDRLFDFYNEFKSILCEANIFNIKEEYNGVSIHGYLKQFAENLPGLPLQQVFIKKITNLLLNDARFHFAVRQLPDNAPDWAKKGVAEQTLFAFNPTPELTETLTHITHYLAAAAQDAKYTPTAAQPAVPALENQKVIAQRELDAFPKAENLDIISKKSEEFFKRGSRKAGRDTSGLTSVYDPGGGYEWFNLEAEDAFRREGKVLQNCIGSIWTKAKCQKEGMAIAVLKNPSNESVVAMRIKVAERELEEVKGKNNKPPIDKYMIPSIKMINYMKLVPSDSAMYDLRNAGYFYDKDKKEIITKQEAIKRFVTAKPISTLDNGMVFSESIVKNSELFDAVYGNMMPSYQLYGYGYSREQNKDKIHIYDLREGGTPVVTSFVKNKELLKVLSHTAQRQMQESEILTSPTMLIIQELFKRELITSIDKNLQAFLLWKEKVRWDPTTQTFVDLKTDAELKTGETHIRWKIFKDRNVIKQMFSTLGTDKLLSGYSISDIDSIYVEHGGKDRLEQDEDDDEDEPRNVLYLILKMKSGLMIPMRTTMNGSQFSAVGENAGFIETNRYQTSPRDQQVIDSFVELANQTKGKLPESMLLHHGIIKQKDKYEQFMPTPQAVPGQVPAEKIDVSQLSLSNRLAALVYLTTERKFNKIPETERHASDPFGIINSITRDYHKSDNYSYSLSDVSKWEPKELEKISQELFQGEMPDSFYTVNLLYGVLDKKLSDKAVASMLMRGNEIVSIDSLTSAHSWKTWNDYDRVAEQLNLFATEHGFTYAPRALLGLNAKGVQHSGEFRIEKGRVTTIGDIRAKAIEGRRERGVYQTEGTDELKFDDNSKMKRMDPKDQLQWSRQQMAGQGGHGEAWKIYDKDNHQVGIVIVDKNEVKSIFTRTASWNETTRKSEILPNNPITNRGLKNKESYNLLSYIKTAVQTFGWKTDQPWINISQNSNVGSELATYGRSAMPRRRGYLRDTDIVLMRLGAIVNSAPATANMKRLSITPRGQTILRDIKNAPTHSVCMLDYVNGIALPKDFVPPVKKEKPAPVAAPAGRAAAAPGNIAAPRTGTAAERALARFRELVAANGAIPTRSEFIRILMQPPFNMGMQGAQTYYYNTKAKYAALGESFSDLAMRELRNDPLLRSFKRYLIG